MGKHKKPAHNRKQGAARLENGRVSRSKEAEQVERALQAKRYEEQEREALRPTLEARVRKYGVSASEAMNQDVGSVVGRLAIIGERGGGISRKQHAAAVQWLEERAQYSVSLASPPDAKAFDLNRTPGRSNAETPQRDAEIRERHEEARRAVQAAQNVLGLKSNLWAAINIIVEQDRDAPNLIGDLREALNALARHYGILHNGKRTAA